MYVYDVLPISLQKEIELDEVEVNRQQKKLGDWHDMYSALNFLSNEPLPSKTTEYVAKFKEKEKKQFYSLLRYLKDHRI